jgi:hypothetical protein
MQSKTVEKIYIDSNVWFSFLSEGQYENKNSIEFNEAESLFNYHMYLRLLFRIYGPKFHT